MKKLLILMAVLLITVYVYAVQIGGASHTSGEAFVGAQKITRTVVNDAAYEVLATDFLIAYTALSAPRQITIPDAQCTADRLLIIKDEVGAATTHNITIEVDTKTIDGAATATISTNYNSYSIYCNGTNWSIY